MATEPVLQSPRTAATEPVHTATEDCMPGACALQQRSHLNGKPVSLNKECSCSLQGEKALHSKKDPAQSKIIFKTVLNQSKCP